MPALFRVLPYLHGAGAGEPGHPMFVPPSTGSSRIGNPGVYEVLYVGDDPAGAVAEAFGWSPQWNGGLVRGSRAVPGSVRALVTYVLDDAVPVCDLDNAPRLVELELRPSQVVTRDRAVTQAWALGVFHRGEFAGVRWWSYFDPRWGSFGLWDASALTVVEVKALSMDDPAVVEAARVLNRVVIR